MSRKGFLFTVGLVFLALVIFGAAFILFQTNLQRERETRLSIYDRITNEVQYIENGFREIVLSVALIEVSDKNVTITEDLPNGKADAFKKNTRRFKMFVENKTDFALKINITEINASLPFLINGTRYYHENGFGGNKIVIANASSVDAYDLYITTSLTNINCNWIDREDATGGVNFTVAILGVGSGPCSGTRYTLERDDTSELKINSTQANIYIRIGDDNDPGELVIDDSENSAVINVRTKMTFNKNNMLTVSLPEQSINITALEYNISKVGAIRIA